VSSLDSFFSSSNALERLQVPAFYVHRLVCVLVITLSDLSLLQGFVCLGVSLLVNSRQKLLLELVWMFRLKNLQMSVLMVEVADSMCMVGLLVYAFSPTIEDSLKLLNLFHGIIFSLLTVSALTTAYQLIVYCRRPRVTSLEI
jgi:hypothetical protein